jgi:hypothetical protein
MEVPYKFIPKPCQLDMFKALDSGCRHAFLLWSRRAGKDLACWNYMIKAALTRVGSYYYFFPEHTQARKVIWEGFTHEGRPYLDYIPPGVIAKKRDDMLYIQLTNGSVIRLLGTNNYDSDMGTNPCGVIYSEYDVTTGAAKNKSARDHMLPIILRNDGWEIVQSTPRGRSNMYQLGLIAQHDPAWFYSVQTIEDVEPEMWKRILKEAKTSGMSQTKISQEYYCDYSAADEGSYYEKCIEDARVDGRIGFFPADPHKLTYVVLDLGIRDPMAAWFLQKNGDYIDVVDFFQFTGMPMYDVAYEFKKKGYKYGTFNLPEDGNKRDIGYGHTTVDAFRDGVAKFAVGGLVLDPLPLVKGQRAIDALRNMFHKFRFNTGTCGQGLEYLRKYHKVWNKSLQCYTDVAAHDINSHAATALALAPQVAYYTNEDSFNLAQTLKVRVVDPRWA